MTAQNPAAGNALEFDAVIEKIQERTKKLFFTVISAAAFVALLWLSMGAADCARVFARGERPLFCTMENGVFRGFGYSFAIEKIPEKSPCAEAKLFIFGIEAMRANVTPAKAISE